MGAFFRLLSGVKNYPRLVLLGISFHLLTAVFTVVSIPLIIPFFKFLFSEEDQWDGSGFGTGLEGWLHGCFTSLVDNYGEDRTLVYICVTVVVIYGLKNLSRYGISIAMVPVRNGLLRDLRLFIWSAFERMSLSRRYAMEQGSLQSLMTNDLMEVDHGILKVFEMLFRLPLVILGSLCIMIGLDGRLTLIAFGLILFTLFIIGGISRMLKKQSSIAQQQLSDISALVEAYLSGLKLIRAHNAVRWFGATFRRQNEDYYQTSNTILLRRDLASPAAEFLAVVTIVILLYVGTRMVMTDEMLPSSFFAFIFAFYNIVDPAKSFAREYANVQKGLAALDRIEVFATVPRTSEPTRNPPSHLPFKESLAFESVSFDFDENNILSDITFRIGKGQKIGLVGKSGSGKTTILDLLLGFFHITQGKITLDGLDIYDLDLEAYRQSFGLVDQRTTLFYGDIKSNIVLGSTVHDDRLAHACDVAHLNHIDLHTRVGDGGTRLSGGEAQRVAIARALYLNPDILLLDEPTAALDRRTEGYVMEALHDLMVDRTVMMVTHRVELLRRMDKILILDQGQIIASGTYDVLVANSAFFRSLLSEVEDNSLV
ncbi:MAG: ABC transporter ATP-binding protein [Bacteroidota bacterium]